MQTCLSREFAFALSDCARLLRTYSDHRARELNMTRAQWAVLKTLERREGLKQSELAEALDLAPITLARLIDKLCESGLVERRDDSADRRANRLHLAPKAAPTLKRLNALGEDLLKRALRGVDAQSVAAMTEQLTTIKANLKAALQARD